MDSNNIDARKYMYYDNTTKRFVKMNNNSKVNTSDNLEERVLYLEDELMKMKESLDFITPNSQNYNRSKTNSITQMKTYDTENLVPRTYKVDKDVQQQFKEFCKENKEYRVSDLVTNALVEYMKNHKY